MKRLLLPLFIILTTLVNAQIVNIPDANFKAALIAEGVDTNTDGEIQVSEAESVTIINAVGENINDLTGIASFVNLNVLSCRDNELISLDLTGLTDLSYLDCSNNQLNSINITDNTNLWSLQCDNNQLTSLDVSSFVNLIELDCSDNQLTALDFTYCSNLRTIRFDNNQLTNVEIVGITYIETLSAVRNNITEIDLSNYYNGVSGEFNFIVNPIDFINIKNGVYDDLFNIDISNESLSFICVDIQEESEIINSIPGWYEFENAVVSSYCNFTPGGIYNTISGNVYFDLDSDGCYADDIRVSNVRVGISNNLEQGANYTDNLGEYYFYTQSGNFELLPSIENASWFDISPESPTIEFTDNNFNTATQDFCVTPVGVHNDVEIMIVPILPARPGFDAIYQMVYRNKGNQTLSGAINFEYDEALLDFVSASIAPDSEGSGILTWNYTDLSPFESRSILVTLNVNAPTETPAVNIGDELDFVANINPIVGDETPLDNEFQFTQTVVGSYDPNDKTCLEGDIVESNQIGEYLHFNINFENTGTAAATFVVVKDFIDETMFDMNTFQVMYASHEMMTQVAGNNIEFIFDNINLGPQEKGNVVFKIKTLDILNVGDSVTNDAEIFFDYNFPIVTNETHTTFQTLSVDEYQLENVVKVYPNPTSGFLHINAQSVIDKIELYDVQGRLVLSQNSNQHELTVDTSSLTKGVYFVKIKSDSNEQTTKIVKE